MGCSKMLGTGREGAEILLVIRTRDIICRAWCKMKTHGPLFKSEEIQDGKHETIRQSTGPFYVQSPL